MQSCNGRSRKPKHQHRQFGKATDLFCRDQKPNPTFYSKLKSKIWVYCLPFWVHHYNGLKNKVGFKLSMSKRRTHVYKIIQLIKKCQLLLKGHVSLAITWHSFIICVPGNCACSATSYWRSANIMSPPQQSL